MNHKGETFPYDTPGLYLDKTRKKSSYSLSLARDNKTHLVRKLRYKNHVLNMIHTRVLGDYCMKRNHISILFIKQPVGET